MSFEFYKQPKKKKYHNLMLFFVSILNEKRLKIKSSYIITIDDGIVKVFVKSISQINNFYKISQCYKTILELVNCIELLKTNRTVLFIAMYKIVTIKFNNQVYQCKTLFVYRINYKINK